MTVSACGPLLHEVVVVVECGVVFVGASRHDVVEAELGEASYELAIEGDDLDITQILYEVLPAMVGLFLVACTAREV